MAAMARELGGRRPHRPVPWRGLADGDATALAAALALALALGTKAPLSHWKSRYHSLSLFPSLCLVVSNIEM